MRSSLALQWARFTSSAEGLGALRSFLVSFYAIWLCYDIADLAFRGTASTYWLSTGSQAQIITALQLALVVVEATVLVFVLRGGTATTPVRILIAASALLRGVECFGYFGLNDFYYFCVTAFVLAQFARSGDGATYAWPRRVLLYQTAWMYLATAVLKLNPHWLSGEHLWVRFGYVAGTLHLSAPWMAALLDIHVDRILAIAGSTAELTIACALLLRAPRWLTLPLAIGIHLFAALTVNVWFFGAAMIAQVAFVSTGRRERYGST